MSNYISAFAQPILTTVDIAKTAILNTTVETTESEPSVVIYTVPPSHPRFLRESDDTKIEEE